MNRYCCGVLHRCRAQTPSARAGRPLPAARRADVAVPRRRLPDPDRKPASATPVLGVVRDIAGLPSTIPIHVPHRDGVVGDERPVIAQLPLSARSRVPRRPRPRPSRRHRPATERPTSHRAPCARYRPRPGTTGLACGCAGVYASTSLTACVPLVISSCLLPSTRKHGTASSGSRRSSPGWAFRGRPCGVCGAAGISPSLFGLARVWSAGARPTSTTGSRADATH